MCRNQNIQVRQNANTSCPHTSAHLVPRVQPVGAALAPEAGGVPAPGAAGPGVAAHVRRVLGVQLAVLGAVHLGPAVAVLQLQVLVRPDHPPPLAHAPLKIGHSRLPQSVCQFNLNQSSSIFLIIGNRAREGSCNKTSLLFSDYIAFSSQY